MEQRGAAVEQHGDRFPHPRRHLRQRLGVNRFVGIREDRFREERRHDFARFSEFVDRERLFARRFFEIADEVFDSLRVAQFRPRGVVGSLQESPAEIAEFRHRRDADQHRRPITLTEFHERLGREIGTPHHQRDQAPGFLRRAEIDLAVDRPPGFIEIGRIAALHGYFFLDSRLRRGRSFLLRTHERRGGLFLFRRRLLLGRVLILGRLLARRKRCTPGTPSMPDSAIASSLHHLIRQRACSLFWASKLARDRN